MGRPDPNNIPPDVAPAAVTHFPAREGPVCGARPAPTEANSYDVDDPTCEKCADWLDKTRAHTAKELARNAQAVASATTQPPGK